MELQINGRGMEISEHDQGYIQKKIGKLTRYLPNITEAKVEIYEEKTRAPQDRITVQVTVNSKGTLLRGEERAGGIYEAVDNVAEALSRQIERYKGKRHDKGRGVSLARKGFAADEATAGGVADESLAKVVRVKHFAVKPMSLAEAIEQMELLGHDFFLFINADNSEYNLLYQRKDGNYGLIESNLA